MGILGQLDTWIANSSAMPYTNVYAAFRRRTRCSAQPKSS